MGGRGSSSGISKGSKVDNSKPAYLAETEKAVKLKANYTHRNTGAEFTVEEWIPKSQLSADGKPSLWIMQQKERDRHAYLYSWQDKNGKKFGNGLTEREKAYAKKNADNFKAGVKSYNDLLSKAKDMGIKGVRKGMKRKTLEQKIREHGGTV